MILQSAQSLLPPGLTRLAIGLHVAGGTVFFACMLVMGGFADYLGLALPDQRPNFFVGTLTIYLVTTAWMTVRRIGRHLWRMCLGVAMATGSAFTNGLPRLLPHGVHLPLLLLFIPQLAVLVLLIFWAARVRFTSWMIPAQTGP